MRSTLRTSALAVVVALLLTGCSAQPQTQEDAPAVSGIAPASGPVVSGDGYSFNAPEGWEETDPSGAPGTDVIAWDANPEGDFADNVNVVISPAGLVPLDAVEAGTVQELEAVGAENITVKDRLTLNGAELTHLAASMTVQGLTYQAEQFAINSDSQTYLITFSFRESVPESERVELAESVLVTWSFD